MVQGTEHGEMSRYRAGCRCAECRAANAETARRWRRGAYSRGWHPATRPPNRRACERCGKPITSRAGRARDGLTLCKQHRDERRDGLRRAATRRRRVEALFAAYAAGGVVASGVWVQGACKTCAEPFVRRGAASPYCSKACNRRDSRPGAFISQSGRLAIYERDGWVCQLCSEPVDSTLHYLDNMSASLDHIEPQSWALIPDHSPSNLRLAHRICNSLRGDRSDDDFRATV